MLSVFGLKTTVQTAVQYRKPASPEGTVGQRTAVPRGMSLYAVAVYRKPGISGEYSDVLEDANLSRDLAKLNVTWKCWESDSPQLAETRISNELIPTIAPQLVVFDKWGTRYGSKGQPVQPGQKAAFLAPVTAEETIRLFRSIRGP